MVAHAGCQTPPKAPNLGTAAEIDGSVLSISDVARHFHRRRLSQDGAGGVGFAADDVLLQSTIKDLIERRLLILAAKKHHLAVFSAEVDAAWRQLTYHWEPQALTSTLARIRLSPLSIKEDLRETLLAQKYVRAMVLDRVAILDQDIEIYLANHPDMLIQPEQVRLRHMVVADALAAKGVGVDLRRGETFADLAAGRSLAADAALGGDLGLVQREDLPSDVARLVFALGPRQMSAPVQLCDGLHVFYVAERLPKRALTLIHARPRAEAILRREGEAKALAAHLQALKASATVVAHEVNLEQIL